MDAKERYRRRKSLRRAMVKLDEVLPKKPWQGRKKDYREVYMAAILIKKLIRFIENSGLDFDMVMEEVINAGIFTAEIEAREWETWKKYMSEG